MELFLTKILFPYIAISCVIGHGMTTWSIHKMLGRWEKEPTNTRELFQSVLGVIPYFLYASIFWPKYFYKFLRKKLG